MIKITLPDGAVREVPKNSTGLDVAKSIGSGLARDAVAVKANGVMMDLTRPLENDAALEIITRTSVDGLELLRHDAAHVLAEAAKEIYPDVQVTIGPAIENGFYYDFFREKPFTPEDLERLEEKMREIVDRDEPIIREEWSRKDAVPYFKSIGENFKAEIIDSIPDADTITVYKQGKFVDLCRGPHLPTTGRLGKAFKLMKLAGAYWRGDPRNPQLQRVYGTAWANEKQLKDYLILLEEAEKRDHRRIAKEMDLFHLQEEAPGCVFWHPNGWTIYQQIRQYIKRRIEADGYMEVNTPVLVDKSLWEASGHWAEFRENMFATEEVDGRTSVLKPMNCPCHIQIFRQGLKSYRDLPIRLAEFGNCHRNESSGSLHGLMRVRSMVQDDGHIFCTEDQIVTETQKFCELLSAVYRDLGFESFHVKLADRPEKRAGTDEVWDRAEKALMQATKAAGIEFNINPGEGAFYGPKLEFYLKDAIGREWQCGTWQVDFILPERLDANYIGEDSKKHRPVMLHRAVLGSLERFIGILIEHYAGKLPLWLAPVQVAVTPITNDLDNYALEVAEIFKKSGLRVKVDLRHEKINYKIREMSLAKHPIICVVGAREASDRTVTVRRLGSQSQEVLSIDQALVNFVQEARMPLDR